MNELIHVIILSYLIGKRIHVPIYDLFYGRIIIRDVSILLIQDVHHFIVRHRVIKILVIDLSVLWVHAREVGNYLILVAFFYLIDDTELNDQYVNELLKLTDYLICYIIFRSYDIIDGFLFGLRQS
jgi:hypothetical protein